MRSEFSQSLVRIARADSSVVLLTGDHGYALFDEFRKHCPDQYINAGIAEQNMVGMAAGLARGGLRPFVYGLSAFVPIRVLEQIKLDVAHDDLPVVFLGDGAGFVYSHLGTSHQSTEDIACTRSTPGLAVYSPADRFELRACLQTAYERARPAYMRMGKSDRGDVHAGPIEGELPELINVRPGAGPGGPAFIATGSMVRTAVDLADRDWPAASVWSLPIVKPFPPSVLHEVADASRCIVVMEEHSVMGGIGGLVAELCSEHRPLPILRIGVQDRFSHHCGSYEYLLREHGLDHASVRDRVRSFLDRS